MATTLIAIAAVALLFILLIVGVPVAFSLALSGAAGIMLLSSVGATGNMFASEVFETMVNYTLVVIPLFILMGMCVKNSRLGEDIYEFLSRSIGRLPGGLGISTVVASAIFATMTGSSAAAVATIGPIAIPQMRRYGYPDKLSAGAVAAAGTLGMLIPPSVVIVLYGILSGQSIERLLIAGIVPGILTAVLYTMITAWLGRPSALLRANEHQPPAVLAGVATGPTTPSPPSPALPQPAAPEMPDISLPQSSSRFSGLRALLEAASIFLVVVGGMYLGFLTAVESAAVGAAMALVILLLRTGGNPRTAFTSLIKALKDGAELSGMIYALLIGASIFTLFMTMAKVPQGLSSFVTGLPIPPTLTVLLVLLTLIPLGMFLDGFSILLVMVPLIHPIIVTDLGFDGVWFAILVVKCIELGLMTPPVGLNVFVTAGAVKGLSPATVFRGVTPFFLVDLVGIAVMFIFPEIITFLPNLMFSN